MSTQTPWFLTVVISWTFNHQTVIFAWILLQIVSIHSQIMKIRHLQHCSGFSCLYSAVGKQFWFLMKEEFACRKFPAFEHFNMYKHPSLSGLPALLLLPFLPALQEHTFAAASSFSGVLREGICAEAPVSGEGGTCGVGSSMGGEGPRSN